MRAVQIAFLIQQPRIKRQAFVTMFYVIDDVNRATDFLCKPDSCRVAYAEIEKCINPKSRVIRHLCDLTGFLDLLQFLAENRTRYGGDKTTLKFLVVLLGRHRCRSGLQFFIR